MEFLYSILGGGFVGAGVVAILFKYLIKSSLQRSFNKYKHELDLEKQDIQQKFEREKQRLQFDIDLKLREHSLNITNFTSKKINAMEEAYRLLTSLMDTFFRIKSWDVYIENVNNDDQKKKLISKALEDYNHHFSISYDKNMKVHEKLLELSLYMPDELEEIMMIATSCHMSITQIYGKEIDSLTEKTRKNNNFEFSFQEFRLRLLKETSEALGPAKLLLKVKIKENLGIKSDESNVTVAPKTERKI